LKTEVSFKQKEGNHKLDNWGAKTEEVFQGRGNTVGGKGRCQHERETLPKAILTTDGAKKENSEKLAKGETEENNPSESKRSKNR